jgi:hypothetical protein
LADPGNCVSAACDTRLRDVGGRQLLLAAGVRRPVACGMSTSLRLAEETSIHSHCGDRL